jgi:inosine-uridine nucleoside N-ribohydrolase
MSTSSLSVAESGPKMVVYDTDMGSDDWIAALLLLRSPQLELKGITVTGVGLTRVEAGVRNARALAALAGEVQGSHSGQTEAVAEGGYPVCVCHGADRAAFEDFFLDTLNA